MFEHSCGAGGTEPARGCQGQGLLRQAMASTELAGHPHPRYVAEMETGLAGRTG